jgi:hypothetical protein
MPAVLQVLWQYPQVQTGPQILGAHNLSMGQMSQAHLRGCVQFICNCSCTENQSLLYNKPPVTGFLSAKKRLQDLVIFQRVLRIEIIKYYTVCSSHYLLSVN